MKYFSLFSGIGGFELGIQQAGRDWECVGYSEIDKYAIQVYEKHFNQRNYGDVTKVDVRELPDFELITGGFPCQSFSIAGKRGGFEDTRGTLFFEICRIVRSKKPQIVWLENVKGLLSHDGGETFAVILESLDELGYDCEWQVLNSKDFGVPQNRERVFIIGHLRGSGGRQVFPIEGDLRKNGEEGGEEQEGGAWVSTLDSRDGQPRVLRQPLRFLTRNQKNIKGDYSFTVDASSTSGVRINTKIRRLTPTECERLQGFPDGWTKGISDTQRYKCLGNAVTVNVIEYIVSQLIKVENYERDFT